MTLEMMISVIILNLLFYASDIILGNFDTKNYFPLEKVKIIFINFDGGGRGLERTNFFVFLDKLDHYNSAPLSLSVEFLNPSLSEPIRVMFCFVVNKHSLKS